MRIEANPTFDLISNLGFFFSFLVLLFPPLFSSLPFSFFFLSKPGTFE